MGKIDEKLKLIIGKIEYESMQKEGQFINEKFLRIKSK